jgi:ATP-binding protein involved in chromosome partitioning
MTQDLIAKVFASLRDIDYPSTGKTLADVHVGDPVVTESEGGWGLELRFAVPIESVAEQLADHIQATFPDCENLTVDTVLPEAPTLNYSKRVAGVKNIIAVASGKGGVGKSTTSVNLALALAKEGANVGLLDADIYGPSQAQMLNVANKRPEAIEGKRILPIESHGIQMMSMGNLVTESTPMVWRGPMVSGALQQLLLNTQWDNVDYLIIDMPPGTGDIPLTLSQQVPVTGAVVVTTPQDIAVLDAKKGIEMFRKVNIPILGLVENMAVHVCSACGHEEHIFGENGAEELSNRYDVAVLGALPLDASIRKQTDAGEPPVVADAESPVAQSYRAIARQLAVAICDAGSQAMPDISIVD